jgi:hypothetical protein
VHNFLQDFDKRKYCLYEHPVVQSSSEELMRYRELCIDAQNHSKTFQNVSQCVNCETFWDKNELKTTLENGEFGMIDASIA